MAYITPQDRELPKKTTNKQREFAKKIAKRIRYWRLAKKVKQIDMARFLGMNYSYFCTFEKGAYQITLYTACKACEKLDISLEQLINGEPGR